MVEVALVDFEKDFDAYMDRIEAGETFIIRQPDGRGVVACPAGEIEAIADELGVEDVDELVDMYSNHEEAS
jgi:hypothetical protein